MTLGQRLTGAVAIRIGALLASGLLPGCTSQPEQKQAAAPPPPCIKPIVLAAVGDVMAHGPLQRWASRQPEGYFAVMTRVQDLLQGADVAIANLEGPAAPNIARGGREVTAPAARYDGNVYSGHPLFNFHPSIIRDLQRMGVDVLQTANNHSLDRGPLGVDRTLAAMEEARMPNTGTRRADARPEGFRWSTSYTVRRDSHAYRFAFISCAYATNGIPDPHRQVLLCYRPGNEPVANDELLAEIRALRADRGNAAVIVMPHWGDEGRPRPDARQTAVAQQMADAGATAIIGTHPHVVQPEAMLTARDGRRVAVVYSLGNFISNQTGSGLGLPRRATVISLLGFTPTQDGRLAVTMTGWIPLRMQMGAVFSVDALDRLSEDKAAPYLAHLRRTFAANKQLPADPARYWNRTAAPVCAPAR